MNKLKQQPDTNTTEPEGKPKEAIVVKMVAAASGVDGVTGGCALWRTTGEPKGWHKLDSYLGSPYKTDEMILKVLCGAIEEIVRGVPVEDTTRLDITCVIFAQNIVGGFNKQREVWESNGFINRLGNKVKNPRLWRKLFKLADRYNVTIRKPKGFSKIVDGCKNRARMNAQNGIQSIQDREVMTQVSESLAKDQS